MPKSNPGHGQGSSRSGRPQHRPGSAPPPSSGGFFDSLGQTLKSAGATAEKYAKLGYSKAESEKERLALYQAHARLGEAVMKVWDDSESVAVHAVDPLIAERVKDVRERREKIAQIREKMNEIRSDGS